MLKSLAAPGGGLHDPADAVATQDTVTQLVAAIRRVAREVPGAAEQIAQVCTGHDYSVPGKPKIDWDDPAAKEALVSALVSDANALVEAFRDAKLDEAAAGAVALLALVAGQDVEPAEGSDGRRAVADRPVARNGSSGVTDPDARHTRSLPRQGRMATGRIWRPTRRPGSSPMRS